MNLAQCQTAEGILFTNTYQLSLTHPHFPVGLLEKRIALNHLSGPLQAFDDRSVGHTLHTDHKPVEEYRQQ